MKVLKVYPNGEAELRDIDVSELFYEVEGEPIKYIKHNSK